MAEFRKDMASQRLVIRSFPFPACQQVVSVAWWLLLSCWPLQRKLAPEGSFYLTRSMLPWTRKTRPWWPNFSRCETLMAGGRAYSYFE